MKLNITKDGAYLINKEHSMGTSIVYISGNLGGGTFTLTAPGGAITDGLMVLGEQYKVEHGAGAPLSIVVAGSTAPDVTIKCVGLK